MASAVSDGLHPRKFGDYVLLKRIAVGGMAEIFEARRAHAEDGPPLVVKVLLPQYAGDSQWVHMLEHEARLHVRLAHPNLVRVLEFGSVNGQPFLVMEFVDGLSLADLRSWLKKRNEEFPRELAAYVVQELLDALAYVHEACDEEGKPLGIVHRDVSPQNVLLSRVGRVLLGDFGIARSNIRDARTRTGVIKGKLRYLAPEQVTSSSTDARTDLYAAGLVLYELLTGEPFIVGETEIELLRAAEAPELSRIFEAPGLDRRWTEILSPALRRFPEERYATALEFRNALEGAVSTCRDGAQGVAALVGRALGEAALPEERPKMARALRARFRGRLRKVRIVLGLAACIPITGVMLHLGFRSRGATLRTKKAPAQSQPGLSPALATLHKAAPNPIATVETERRTSEASTPTLSSRAPRSGQVSRRAELRMDPTLPEDAIAEETPTRNRGVESELLGRLTTLRSNLAARGILTEDLANAQRAAFDTIADRIRNGQHAEAEIQFAHLENEMRELRVDGPFVRHKLDRVNAAIQAAKGTHKNSALLESQAAAALQAYIHGRYESTNQHLNEILKILRQSR